MRINIFSMVLFVFSSVMPLGASGSLREALGASGRLWEVLGGFGRLWEDSEPLLGNRPHQEFWAGGMRKVFFYSRTRQIRQICSVTPCSTRGVPPEVLQICGELGLKPEILEGIFDRTA